MILINQPGDLFSVSTGLLVHGCNCLGAMGAGVAAGVRQRYPKAYDSYAAVCASNDPKDLLGKCQYVLIDTASNDMSMNGLIIVNAFTQLAPGSGREVNYEAVATCFEDINRFLISVKREFHRSLTVSFPKIGAGLAGGSWDVIEKIIDVSVSDDFQKVLYVPA